MLPGDAEQADLMALKCSSMSFFTEGNAAVLPTHCCEERTARHWFLEIGGYLHRGEPSGAQYIYGRSMSECLSLSAELAS